MTSALSRLSTDVLEMFGELATYRELLYQMTRRDLLLRYKQTAMGVGWAMLMPLTNTAVFSVIFTQVAKMETDVPYPLFAYLGLIAWNFTSGSLRFAVNSLTSNTQLVTKVYFPREVFPFSQVIVSLADFGVSALVLVVLMIYYGVMPSAYIVLLPIILIVHVLLTAAFALLLAMANLFFRDVKYVFEVVIVVAMFATSAVYPPDKLQGNLGALIAANPMTVIIEAYRDVLLYGQVPALVPFALTTVFALAIFSWAWLVFHRAEFRFAENI
jgi:ABC-type polysaccharide/polyol phosphate export permease